MVRRRRPLLRAGMLGGIGFASYQAGKRMSIEARLESIARLKDLLDSGALTQAEFDAEKQRILRS